MRVVESSDDVGVGVGDLTRESVEVLPELADELGLVDDLAGDRVYVDVGHLVPRRWR